MPNVRVGSGGDRPTPDVEYCDRWPSGYRQAVKIGYMVGSGRPTWNTQAMPDTRSSQRPRATLSFLDNYAVAICICTALCIGIPRIGLAFEKPTASRDLNFSYGESALSALERQRLIEWILYVRGQDWCPLETVAVEGHADKTEGTPISRKRLAESRASYVTELIKRHGIPAQVIFSGISLWEPDYDQAPKWGGRVEIGAVGSSASPRCSYMVGPTGFRTAR